MFTHTKYDLNVYFIGAIVLCGIIITVNTVDVRLKDGQAENQGRVEVRRHANETWGKVCDMNFGEVEAAAVCRQLNYKYSRKDDKVYIPDYPDYRLENFKCKGSESNFSDCISDVWKTGFGKCDTRDNAYAGVCCSNSSKFGESHDGIFVSHCADTWIDAEEKCENKKAILASLNEYKEIFKSIHKPTSNGVKDGKGYWTKSFFTPWIWSNGCFKFKTEKFKYQEFNLENNTAQACLQMCSIASQPSSFLLSGKFCRCLATESLKSKLSEVLPGWCNKRCLGDTSFFCGSGSSGPDSYWSLYTVASEDIFYKISDPQTHQHKQCAILESSRKLSSENCYKRVGYICGQILQENATLPKLMFFQNSRFYEVLMNEARMKCTSDDSTMRLIGENILKQDVVFSQPFVNLWVDISRVLAEAYPIYWVPINSADTSLWRNLEPRWCLATRQRDPYFSDEITACNTRFRYICSSYNKKEQSESANGSSSQNSNDTGTGYKHNNSITEVVDIEITHVNYVQDENSPQGTGVIAIVCGLLLLGLIIVAAYFLIRMKMKRRREETERKCQSGFSRAPQNAYDASIRVNSNSTEHMYAELKPSENIYNEIDALIDEPNNKENPHEETNDLNDEAKETVTMKRSYSSPKDLQNMVEGQENNQDDFKDPNYIYPYDKVTRSEADTIASNDVEEKTNETDEIENADLHNKHTVV